MLRLTRRSFATALALGGSASATPSDGLPASKPAERGAAAVATFASRAAAANASIAPEVRQGLVSLLGFYAPGDGGAADYRFAAEQASGPGRFRSRDGGWWELAEPALHVRMFGARADGASDDAMAFNEATDFLETRGGALLVPAGRYVLGSPWRIQRSRPVNLSIRGYGACLVAGRSLSEAAIQVTGSMNEFLIDFEGLYFDHRGAASVQGCFEVLGGHCVDIRRCVVEFHSVKAGYYFACFRSNGTGRNTDDYNAFWCRVEACSTRKRSGNEPGEGTYGIKLVGTANAFIARDNVLSHLAYGIYAETDPATGSLANGVVIEGNAFEGISKAAVQIQMNGARLGPTGWRLAFNRAESLPTFFGLSSRTPIRPHSQPPFLIGNYCTSGSVKTWVDNPTNHPVSLLESQMPGTTPAAANVMWQGARGAAVR